MNLLPRIQVCKSKFEESGELKEMVRSIRNAPYWLLAPVRDCARTLCPLTTLCPYREGGFARRYAKAFGGRLCIPKMGLRGETSAIRKLGVD